MRVYLSLLAVFICGLAHAQSIPGSIIDAAVLPNGMDPNGDGWITSTGSAFTGPLDETEFELPFRPIPAFQAEPVPDNQVPSSSCTMYELVGDGTKGAESTYYYYQDPDGVADNGDERIFFRFRVARVTNSSVAYSILIDTDHKFGFSGPDADPNAVAGNPGFELEVSVINSSGQQIRVYDADGVSNPTVVNASYSVDTNLQVAYALNQDPDCSSRIPGFVDIYFPFSGLDISSSTQIRMVGASSELTGSVLGGRASDIGGVDGNTIASDDDQFIAVIGSFPDFSFQGDNNGPPSGMDGTVSLNENSANGTAVHTVSAFDPDGDILTYKITAGNTNTAFVINSSTGAITVNNSTILDFETATSYSLTITVSDGTLSDNAVITINLNNVNETPSATDATASLNENSANGTAIHTVSASDPDGDVLTYAITAGNISTTFAINGSGQISVSNAAALNFETTTSYSLIVRVSDGTLFDDAAITINLNNVNETPSATDATVSLNENSPNGTEVHTVSASDPDGDVLTYAITAGNTSTVFAINSSGQISVSNAAALDFETTPSFTLTVSFSDGSLSDNVVIIINLKDVNEAPSATDATVSLNENSANGTEVNTVSASDPDGDVLTYAITAGNTSTTFAINNSGQISVTNTAALDFETTASHSLTVRVSDGTLFDDAAITINLNNVNETPSATDATVSLNENSPNGATVHTVSASDPDGDVLVYSITAGNTNTAFAINSSTGVITVNNSNAVDVETAPSFTLTVKVSDGTLFDDAVITIHVNNFNRPPVATDAALYLEENSPDGTAVHTVAASDPDGDVLTYAITSGNGDNAFIISDNGLISVNRFSELDFETSPRFIITVRVSDGERFTDAIVTIDLRDINEPPSIDDAAIKISQNLPSGTVVHKVVSRDPDGGDAAVFSIEAGNFNSAFIINESTGEVIVNSIEEYEPSSDPAFDLTVMVTDAGGLTATANLTIQIENVEQRNVINPLKGFSPDGDGINDFWLIKGIEAFPDNEVKVFNRWGNLVFESRNYDNNQIAWRGEGHGALTIGDNVPETTYFFLINIKGLLPITGYVVMKE